MASKTRALPIRSPLLDSFSPVRSGKPAPPERNSAFDVASETADVHSARIVLYHNSADENWTRQVVERIEIDGSGSSDWVRQPSGLNISCAISSLAEAERHIRKSLIFGIVVSGRMLEEDCPALEKLIMAHSDLRLPTGRIVAILRENVTLPPLLRMGDWFDFRGGSHMEGNVRDLLGLLNESPAALTKVAAPRISPESKESFDQGWKTRPLFAGAKKVRERIVSNLFPVVEIPKEIFSAESRFCEESEVRESCEGPGPLPFLLQGSRLYAFAPISENSALAPALAKDGKASVEPFSEWLSDSIRAPRAIELLNRLLRYHAWKRGLRMAEKQGLFFFTRSKPKNLWWEIGGKTIQREVTAPNIKWNPVEHERIAEFQCGWRHEAIRAVFLQIHGALFLRLEPAWLLTELDGKTPANTQSVEPLQSTLVSQAGNGHVLRTLRFWSAILAKGHRELRMDTGTNPIRVRLTPASGSSQPVVPNDLIDFDRLALTDLADAQLIPELRAIDR